MLTRQELQALRIIDGRGNTDLAASLVSRQARSLLAQGLIDYAPERDIAYVLTPAGRSAMVDL